MVTEGVQKNQLDEKIIKHMIFNSLMNIKNQFGNKYGELVICVDGKTNWRKKIFPFYKENRKKDRDNSFIDWTMLYQTIDHVINDLKMFFPYKVIEYSEAEADDIIAILTKDFHQKEKILIISEDRDFYQLHAFKNVEQFGYRSKKMLKVPDPLQSLAQKIVKGDAGDGVPNIRSDDDTFIIESKRQSPVSAKMLELWSQGKDYIPDEYLQNYKRNDQLINFQHIPTTVEHHILKEFGKSNIGNKRSMYNYFMQNNMKKLLGQVGKF